MFNFIRNQWVMRKIDEAKVRAFIGIWISQEEATMILATPQVPAEIGR